MRSVFLLPAGAALFALCLHAQKATPPKAEGIPPRSAPSDYLSHGPAGRLTIAAEFTGHSVATPDATLRTDDYVVVEVGIYGPPGAHATISAEDFALRINGKKPTPGQPYGLVVGSLKDPELEPTADEQKSKTKVGTGGQQDSSPPPPYRVPDELRHKYSHQLQALTLPEGDRTLPVAGLLYFQYHGKRDKIDSLKLIYSGAAGKGSLTLQP
ncbi:MAG TPA: hypothetical protein VMI94_16130 [Bryobacteraceae bacterium]|nr:hypothetical protein [Bryobacteraceae bacterium]